MTNKSKLLGSVLLAVMAWAWAGVSLIDTVQAQLNTPTLASGVYLDPQTAPCIPYNLMTTDSTTEKVVRSSATTDGKIGGPGYISWILLNPGVVDTSTYVVFKDTGLAGTSTEVVSLIGNVYAGSKDSSKMLTFTPPIRFAKGLTMKASAPLDATVCTRLYKTQTP